MKILFLTDTHITAKSPSSRVDVATDILLEKWREIRYVVDKEGIDLILHGGDFNNTPDVSNSFTGEIASIIREMKAPMYVVPGNHDLYGYNITTLDNTKLGVLANAGVVNILKRGQGLEFDDVVISGQEYYDKIDTGINNDYMMDFTDDKKLNILVAHSMLMDHKFIDEIPHTVINDVVSDADLILAGHYHPGFDTVSIGNTTFANPGSIYRNSNSKYHFDKPGYLIIETLRAEDGSVGREITRYNLKCAKSIDEVFKQKESETIDYSLANFNRKLDNMEIKEAKLIDLVNKLCNEDDRDLSAPAEIVRKELIKASQLTIDKGFVESENVITIDKVKIKNFQVHENVEFDFCNGFNVICGESNAGKSSLLRAIIWALYDKPNNSRFIRTGTKSCSVELYLSNGYKITRSRSHSSAGQYKIDNDELNYHEEFKGFSNKLPIEVANATQMPEITINGNKYYISIQQQLDDHFIVRYVPTEAISLIGALVGADEAIVAKKGMTSVLREQNSRLSIALENIEEVEEQLKAYDGLDSYELKTTKAENILNKMEVFSNELNDIKDIAYSINETINNIYDITSEIERLSLFSEDDKETLEDLRKQIKEYEEMKSILDDINTKEDKLSDIEYSLNNDIISNTEDIKDSINNVKPVIDELSELINLANSTRKTKLTLDKTNKAISEIHIIDINSIYNINDMIKDLESVSGLKLNIETKAKQIKENENNLHDLDVSLDKLKEHKELYLNDLRSKEDICDKCGSIIDYNKLIEEAI